MNNIFTSDLKTQLRQTSRGWFSPSIVDNLLSFMNDGQFWLSGVSRLLAASTFRVLWVRGMEDEREEG